jgi:hypothetical protein
MITLALESGRFSHQSLSTVPLDRRASVASICEALILSSLLVGPHAPIVLVEYLSEPTTRCWSVMATGKIIAKLRITSSPSSTHPDPFRETLSSVSV